MSTPMYDDLPEHFIIGVTKDGGGPVDETDPNFHHYECWHEPGAPWPCPEATGPAPTGPDSHGAGPSWPASG